ncbi:MAG: hypothetical protein N3D20_02490 [Candidatus Pacearchaeota archaeon]|nr:hypothetical protein [Candidatus Pacearchaeota archaeon]
MTTRKTKKSKKAQTIISFFLLWLLIFIGIVIFDIITREKTIKTEETKTSHLQTKAESIIEKVNILKNIKNMFIGIIAIIGYKELKFLSFENIINFISIAYASFLIVFYKWALEKVESPDNKDSYNFSEKIKNFFKSLTKKETVILILLISAIIATIIFSVLYTKWGTPIAILLISIIITIIAINFIMAKNLVLKWFKIFVPVLLIYLIIGFWLTQLKIIIAPLFSDYGLNLAMAYEEIISPLVKAFNKQIIDYSAYNQLIKEYARLIFYKSFYLSVYIFTAILIIYLPEKIKKYLKTRAEKIEKIMKEEKLKEGLANVEIGAEMLKEVGSELKRR